MSLNHNISFTPNKVIKRLSPLLLTFAFLLLSSPQALAHTFHTSLSRVDYNAEQKTAEITIQVFAHDLENAIEKQVGKRVNLDKKEDAARLILDYLATRFVLKNAAGETKKLVWIGQEQSADALWLYIESAMPEGIENATLENRILFEMFNDQVNLLTVRAEKKKFDFSSKAGDKNNLALIKFDSQN